MKREFVEILLAESDGRRKVSRGTIMERQRSSHGRTERQQRTASCEELWFGLETTLQPVVTERGQKKSLELRRDFRKEKSVSAAMQNNSKKKIGVLPLRI